MVVCSSFFSLEANELISLSLAVLALTATYISLTRNILSKKADKESVNEIKFDIIELKKDKADQQWVKAELSKVELIKEHVGQLFYDFKEEIKISYESSQERNEINNDNNKEILKRIEKKIDDEKETSDDIRKIIVNISEKVNINVEKIRRLEEST